MGNDSNNKAPTVHIPTTMEVKTYIMVAQTKLTLNRNKRINEIKRKKSEAASSLKQNNLEVAKAKMDSIIRLEDIITCYDILGPLCEILKERVTYIMSSFECPPDLRAQLDSVIYASTRMEIEELHLLRNLIAKKYGVAYVNKADTNVDKLVNVNLIEKLKVKNSSDVLVTIRLKQLCKEMKIPFEFPSEINDDLNLCDNPFMGGVQNPYGGNNNNPYGPPGNNPYGGPNNPYVGPNNPYGGSNNPYNGPNSNNNSYGLTYNNPYGSPSNNDNNYNNNSYGNQNNNLYVDQNNNNNNPYGPPVNNSYDPPKNNNNNTNNSPGNNPFGPPCNNNNNPYDPLNKNYNNNPYCSPNDAGFGNNNPYGPSRNNNNNEPFYNPNNNNNNNLYEASSNNNPPNQPNNPSNDNQNNFGNDFNSYMSKAQDMNYTTNNPNPHENNNKSIVDNNNNPNSSLNSNQNNNENDNTAVSKLFPYEGKKDDPGNDNFSGEKSNFEENKYTSSKDPNCIIPDEKHSNSYLPPEEVFSKTEPKLDITDDKANDFSNAYGDVSSNNQNDDIFAGDKSVSNQKFINPNIGSYNDVGTNLPMLNDKLKKK